MPDLHRSCQACVAAKRSCDLRTPCRRCSTRHLSCYYTNEPSTSTSVDGTSTARRKIVAQDCQHVSVSALKRSRGLRLDIYNPKQLELARVFSRSSMALMVEILKRFPTEFWRQGGTDFIHPQLYATTLPIPLRNFQTTYATYTFQSGNIFWNNKQDDDLAFAISTLLMQAQKAKSIQDLIAHVQALVLLQIIRLFDGGSLDDNSIESDNDTLWSLAHGIWEESPTLAKNGKETWSHWMLAESARRTILICNIMLEVYRGLKRGYVMFHPCVEALPFNCCNEMWDSRSEDSWERISYQIDEQSLTSVRELRCARQRKRTLSPFDRLLLVSFSV